MSKRWQSIFRGSHGSNRLHESRMRRHARLRREALTNSVPAEVFVLEPKTLMASGVMGPELLANGVVAGPQRFTAESDRSFAYDRSGRAIVVWSTPSTNGPGSKIVARRFSYDGAPLGAEFTVGWSSSPQAPSPVVAVRDGHFVIAWDAAGEAADRSARGVFARVYTLDATPLTDTISIPSVTAGDQFDPAVAWIDSDRFVVTWSHGANPATGTVYGRTFDVTGAPVSDAFRLSGFSTGGQRHAVVAGLPDGKFQAVWSGRGVGDANGIYTRIFDTRGRDISEEIQVNKTRGAVESQPVLAADANQVVIAWQVAGHGADRSGLGVFARRFDLSGAPLGAEFRVSETALGRQASPSVALLETGGFVIAWEGNGKGDSSGVHLREFAADGAPLGGEQRVNGTVAGVQSMPTVHARGADGYGVSWAGQIGAGGGAMDRQGIALRATQEKPVDMPTTSVGSRDEVMTFTIPGIGEINKVSPKIMQFTNTTDRTIYPILQGANSNKVEDANSPNFGLGLYDPYDPVLREYRGYIGYIENNQYYLGLKPGQTVTVHVPLVFWDSGRLLFASDGSNLIPAIDQIAPTPQKPNSPNPFHYHEFQNFVVNDAVIAKLIATEKVPKAIAEKLDPLKAHGTYVVKNEFEAAAKALIGDADWGVYSNSIFNVAGAVIQTKRFRDELEDGKHVVLWYQAQNIAGLAEGPSGGAPFQLGEMTYRSDIFKNPLYKTAKDIDPTGKSGETHNLVNYDVSYVDSMTLPVAMEAFDVPLDPTGEYTKLEATFGWVGANMKLADLQGPLKAFTSPNTTTNPNLNGMGDYFFGNGYPKYYIPTATEAVTGIKVPAGQNLALESPTHNTKSTWDENRFLITSAGSAPIVLGSLGSVKAKDTKIYFASASYMDQLKAIKEALDGGLTVNVKGSLNDLAPGTIVKDVNLTPDKDGYLTVTIDPTNLKPEGTTGGVYDFSRPVVDYVMERLANLWFSWADLYWNSVKNVQPEPSYAGTLAKSSNQIMLTTPADPSKLVVGMPVSGPGVPASLKATIMAIELNQDKTKVVSIRISKISTDGGSGSFTVEPVKRITPQSTDGFAIKPYTISFGSEKDTAYAQRFARSLYLVMDSMNTIPFIPGQGPAVVQLMANVLGGNIGFVPNIGVAKNQPITNPFAASITVTIRDNVKSILRGVDDFMVDTEENGNWYPDPSLKGSVTGQMIDGKEATFNVMNLNPFVWFVHKKLGLSGYGFSLDDDAADVGADGANKLRIVIGQVDDLPVDQFYKAEWTHGAPYGPVKSSKGEFELINSGDFKGKYMLKGLDTTPLPVAFQVFGTGSAGEPGALVTGPGIEPGTRVLLPIPSINAVILDKPVKTGTNVKGPYFFSGTPPKVKADARAVKAGRQSWELSVTGSDDFYGDANLLYSWSLVSGPQGGKATFSPSQQPPTNALKNSQVVIAGPPGTYVIQAKIAQKPENGGFFTTSTVRIVVT